MRIFYSQVSWKYEAHYNYKDDEKLVFGPLRSGPCDIIEQGSGGQATRGFQERLEFKNIWQVSSSGIGLSASTLESEAGELRVSGLLWDGEK